MDGKSYLADVGLGEHTFTTPLEMKLDVAQNVSNGTYRFVANGQGTQSWFVEKILPDKPSIRMDGCKEAWSVMYRFSLKPRLVSDFLEACHYHQTNKESLFVCKSLATLFVPAGVRVYIGFIYKELAIEKNGAEQVVEQRNLKDNQIEEVLKEKFGIVVDNFVPRDDPIIIE